jgi:hypothetical protein
MAFKRLAKTFDAILFNMLHKLISRKLQVLRVVDLQNKDNYRMTKP